MRSRERETAMNSDFRDKLSNAATAVEITLGMVILIACIVSGIGMVAMTDMNKLFGDPAYLQARMSSACFKPLHSNTVTLLLFADFPLGKSGFFIFHRVAAPLRRGISPVLLCRRVYAAPACSPAERSVRAHTARYSAFAGAL